MKSIQQRETPDIRCYIPDDLPAEFLAFDTAVPSLGVGSSGKIGLLELDFSVSAGATRVVRQFQQLPLYIFHPLYIDPKRRDIAFIYLLQSGEGIVQGDRYRMDFNCASGTAAHITTQAATKIYGMKDNFATQMVNLNVGSGAFIEYLPDPTIPFQASRFYQCLTLTIDPDATAIIGETLMPGRAARGEMHAYTLYYTDFKTISTDGKLLFADHLKLGEGLARASSPGILGAYTILSSFYVVTRRLRAAVLAERLHEVLAAQPEVLGTASELPNGCGVFTRILGRASMAVEAAMKQAWSEARLALFDLPVPDLRKM